MRIDCFVFLIVCCLVNACFARRDLIQRTSTLACSFYFAKITQWDFQPQNSDFYSTVCNFTPASQSWTICIHDTILFNSANGGTEQVNKLFIQSLEYVNNICQNNWNVTFYLDLLNNGTHYLRSKPDDNSHLINFPIKIDPTKRERINNAYHIFSRNTDISNLYGGYLYIYCGFILLIGAIIKYFGHIAFNVVLYKFKILRWIRGYITIPTFFEHHADYFEKWHFFVGLIPTRLESTIIIVYLLQHTYLLFANYELDEFSLLLPSKKLQIIRYFADRAGIMSFAHFPLIILFCTRNSIVEFLTDLNFASSISFHKWFGRIMCLDAVLHATAYLYYACLTNSFGFSKHQAYYQMGIVACFILILLVFLSFGFFRKYYYETFLYGHIILALCFFYSCWKHVENLGWKDWIYSSICIWFVERLIRLIRIISSGLLRSKITLIDDDLIEVRVRKPVKISSPLLNSTPGQYYFIYFMHPLIFWQSHPFTVINHEDSITMIFKPKDGATKTIKNLLLKNNLTTLNMNVALEGPYGKSPTIQFCDKILFLTGGTGLPGPISHILEFISRENFRSYIYLPIVVRDVCILEAYRDALLKLNHPQVQIDLYVTGKIQDPAYSNSIDNVETTPLLAHSSTSHLETVKMFENFCRVHRHRPHIKRLINTAAEETNSLAVVCCGAPTFVDISRNAIAEAILQHPDKSILYYEEFQCW